MRARRGRPSGLIAASDTRVDPSERCSGRFCWLKGTQPFAPLPSVLKGTPVVTTPRHRYNLQSERTKAGCLGGERVAQFNPGPAYDHDLAERAIAYLQTRDSEAFPFTASFDAARQRAFMRDLREGLSDLTDSGSARKTSASGFIMRDRRLREIVSEWAAAGGGWPRGADPRNPDTALGSIGVEDDDAGTGTGRR